MYQDEIVYEYLTSNEAYQHYVAATKIKMIISPILGVLAAGGYGYITQLEHYSTIVLVFAILLLSIAFSVLSYLVAYRKPTLCKEVSVNRCIERESRGRRVVHLYHVKDADGKYYNAEAFRNDTTPGVFLFQNQERAILIKPSRFHNYVVFPSNIPVVRSDIEEFANL